MSWYRVEGRSAFHPKVIAAGNAAWGAFTRMGAHCTDNLTDGFVSADVAKTIGTKTEIARLVAVKLLEQVDGGYRLHDFHDYNPTADEARAVAAERRAKRSASGKLGAIARWGDGHSKPMASAMANGMANAIKNGWQKHGSESDPDLDPDPERNTPPPSPLSSPPRATDPDANPEWGLGAQSGTRLVADPLGSAFIGDAWAQGVAAGTGRPKSAPNRAQLEQILAGLAAHGPKGTAAVRSAWVRAEAEKFGRSRRGTSANTSGWSFVEWLDNGSPSSVAGGRRGSSVQPAAEGAPWMRDDYDGTGGLR